MFLDWDKLKINQAELDLIFEPNIISSWAIALGRIFILRRTRYWKTFLLTESSLLFLSLLFFFPVNLIFFRKLGWLDNNTNSFIIVFTVTVSLSLLTLIILNYYLEQKAKRLKLLIQLLEKVDGYNQLINNFKLLSKIESINNTNNDRNSRSITELKAVLSLTKSSLLKSIEVESFIYHRSRDRQLVYYDRARLLADLENDLANLFIPEINSGLEYQLLNEAVNLGLSIHQEIRKIQL